MKRGAILLTFALVLLSVLPMVAFAANQTDMSTVVTYTKDAPQTSESDTESPPDSPSSTYEINIPAMMSLNEGQELYITSNYMNLNDGQTVYVTLDGRTFSENVYMFLTNKDNEKIRATVNRPNLASGDNEIIQGGDVVAKFTNSGTAPVEYGSLFVVPFQEEIDAAAPGTYTGTIHFRIGLIG